MSEALREMTYETGGNMITMTIDIASVFLGICIGSIFTLFICWLTM